MLLRHILNCNAELRIFLDERNDVCVGLDALVLFQALSLGVSESLRGRYKSCDDIDDQQQYEGQAQMFVGQMIAETITSGK